MVRALCQQREPVQVEPHVRLVYLAIWRQCCQEMLADGLVEFPYALLAAFLLLDPPERRDGRMVAMLSPVLAWASHVCGHLLGSEEPRRCWYLQRLQRGGNTAKAARVSRGLRAWIRESAQEIELLCVVQCVAGAESRTVRSLLQHRHGVHGQWALPDAAATVNAQNTHLSFCSCLGQNMLRTALVPNLCLCGELLLFARAESEAQPPEGLRGKLLFLAVPVHTEPEGCHLARSVGDCLHKV
mmetsp:Transcript_110653/g.308282  ORF Transcript_110653/g.308282 Transcript_110653/m.308282 type:complete len:242 (-) Transcript_110653:940-1665(-)